MRGDARRGHGAQAL